jgi:uncharacterized protein
MLRFECGLEIKNLTQEGVIEGYGAIFGNVDSVGDRIQEGAFAKGLAQAAREKRSIKMLWNHDPAQPIGVWDELSEDAKGLFGRGRLSMRVQKAQEVHALMQDGVIDTLSIGYRTEESKPEGNVRLLTKLSLYEISPVPFAANIKARVTTVKAEGIEEILEKLKAGDRLTEREFEAMAKGLGLSNSQAERAARINLKGQGEPAKAANEALAFFQALHGL